MATTTHPIDPPPGPSDAMTVPEAPVRPQGEATAGVTSPPSRSRASSRFLLRDVSFATYRALRDDLDRAGHAVRLTFDRGTLELITLSFEHERESRLIYALVVALATGLDVDFEPAGSMTLTREVLDRGLEPDECFYLANEPRVRGRAALDLASDPPPDLAIEVDVFRSSIDKLGIYAALRVPEFWRVDGDVLHFLGLGPDGVYRPIEASQGFPGLRRDEAEEWLRRRRSMRTKDWLRELHAWVRDVLAPRLGDQAGR